MVQHDMETMAASQFSVPRANISGNSSYVMSICIMLYSIELFPPVNYDFGPLEACFSVAPAFVDAMLPAPFLHEFQRTWIPKKLSFLFLFLSKHFYEPPTGWYHAQKINSWTLKKARIPDHFMSWSPCWWSWQALKKCQWYSLLSILEFKIDISSHFIQWSLHVV